MTNPIPAIARRCPACKAAELQEATSEDHFYPHGKQVTVALRVSRCPACGMEMINAEQRRENLVRLKARKSEYGDLLMGEEIVGLRKRYGLTQDMAAKIFGKGKIAFSRYENEASYPDASMTKLLNLAIDLPEALKMLADKAGVQIPLWEARMEDEHKAKAAEQNQLAASQQLPKPTRATTGWLATKPTASERTKTEIKSPASETRTESERTRVAVLCQFEASTKVKKPTSPATTRWPEHRDTACETTAAAASAMSQPLAEAA